MEKEYGPRPRFKLSPSGSLRGSPRRGGPLEGGEIGQGVLGGLAAHLFRRPQAGADLGALRPAEDPAEVVVRELDAADAGGLAVRHPGDRGGDRESDAAGAAAGTAIHD